MGKVGEFFVRHPFLKGVTAYTILWPSANLLHQARDKHRAHFDYFQAIHYGLVGVTCVCPVFYGWLKIINGIYPATHFKACIIKVICEQTLYWPIAITVFFAGMNFYESRTWEQFKEELREKYWKTHKTGLMFWPFVAPFINYSKLISDHNRTPVAAAASFLWASFLSYVKELELKHKV